MYDSIIVGAGPAVLTAAIYLLREGKKILILETETIGGKIASSPRVENYPGYQTISGSKLTNNMYEQVLSLNGQIEFEEVLSIEKNDTFHIVTDMNEYDSKTVVIASGSSNRFLGLDNEEYLVGNGISFCTVCDGAFYKDKVVAVVGGGNSGIVNALNLSNICNKVYLIVRSEKLKGEIKEIESVENNSKIEIMYNTIIKDLIGSESLEGIIVTNGEKTSQLDVECLFISIGQDPNTNYLDSKVNLSDSKYIKTDLNCETNIAGLFACGDVIDKKVRQLTTAVSDGTVAALSVIDYLK